jgi:hypothetical protein
MASVGGLMILLSADWRDDAISPGPLARQHAQLLNDGSDSRCAACHAAAERSAAGWAASLVAGHGRRPDQSERCMECHERSISIEFARSAHNLPAVALERVTESGKQPGLSRRDEPAGSRNIEQLACVACHREHRGGEADLTAMNDDACQSCHRRRYQAFDADHPDFETWPYQRRTRIAFNHASHRAKHFVKKKQAFDCLSCHVDDATGEVQLLASYDAACAACHDEKIAESVASGVPMLLLPTLDAEALRAAGHEIGAWPVAASGDFDGRLPPMMKLLLAGDPLAARAMEMLGADFEFLDVDPDDPKQLEACAALARSIKKLLAEIGNEGAAAAPKRLEAALGLPVPDAELKALFAGFDQGTLQGALGDWLPDTRPGRPSSPGNFTGRRSGIERPIGYAAAGTWIRDEATLAIRYRAAAHADPVLTAWLEVLAAAPQLTKRPLALAMFRELSKPTAAGLCASCHSVEQSPRGGLTINWRAYDRAQEPRGFTKFSHGPHVVLPRLADCTACHAIDDAKSSDRLYEDWSPDSFVSEFAPLSKQRCVECHTARAAGDACQMCHNYHVEAVESWRLR